MPWYEYALLAKFRGCGIDIRALSDEGYEVLRLWINGEVPTQWFLQNWPLPGGSGPIDSTVCLVNSVAPII